MSSSPPQPASHGNGSYCPAVLIVILNWNSPEETKAAVESSLRMDYPNCRVVIIDNGSTDHSIDILSTLESDRVQLIRSNQNLGYTGGCNLGFDLALRSGADYVWLLNNDAVTNADTLSSLVRVAQQDETIGLASPIIASLQEPSKLINVGGIYKPQVPDYLSTRDLDLARAWAETNPEHIMLLGTALLVKTTLIRKIGALDPVFFAYWEDIDFSLRSIKAGFRNVVDFNSSIYHKEKPAGSKPYDMKQHYWYYMARNESLFWKKHVGLKARLKALWWAYETQLRNLEQLRGNEGSRQAVLAGLWDGWTNRTGPYRSDLRMPRLLANIIEFQSRKRATKSTKAVSNEELPSNHL